MDEIDINGDLAVFNGEEEIPTPVESVEVAESEPGTWSPFGADEEEERDPAAAMFDGDDEIAASAVNRVPIMADKRPLSAMLMAVALADPSTTNDITTLNGANLAMAEDLLNSGQEYNARVRVAANRSIDTLKYLDNLQSENEKRAAQGDSIPEGVQDLINQTYKDVVAANVERNANYAVEMEAVERVRDLMTQGDLHEAYIVREQFLGEGGADQQMINEMTRAMIASQRMQELEAEYQNSGWIRGFFNGVVRLVPFVDSFSAAGILNDAGIEGGQEGGLLNFILRGNNLTDQREALWGLPLDEFAAAMTADGPVMSAIRANADFLMNDPARMAEVGSVLLSQTDGGGGLENVFGALDAGLFVGGSLGRVTKTLTRLGARKSAVDLTTKAVLEAIANGPDAARRATAIGTEELSETLAPSFLRGTDAGVSLSSDVVANLRAAEDIRKLLPDVVATQRFDSAEDIQAMYQAMEKTLKEEKYGQFIKDIRFVEENVRTGTSKTFAGEVAQDGATVYRVEVIAGKKSGGGYAKESYAKGLFKHFGRDGEVIKDPDSGQYFAKFEVELPADGFISGTLNTPDAALAGLRSSARTADAAAVAKGLVAGNSANRLHAAVGQIIKGAVKGLPSRDRKVMNEIIKKGQNEAKWYDEAEFDTLFERQTGQAPSKATYDAYQTFRSVSDLDYVLRNEAMYIKKYNQGYSSHRFSFEGTEVDVDGIIIRDPKQAASGRMWDASSRRWLDENISGDEIKKMADEGYVRVRLDQDLMLPDGTSRVRDVMIKSGDIRSRTLRRQQLNYSQGGSRAYDATHFIKQAAEDFDGKLLSPKAHIAGKNLNEMKEWARKMNLAVDMAARDIKDPFRYDDLFENAPGFPTGEEFLRMVADREINLKHKFEVVEDQGLPSAYFGKSQEDLRFVDLNESGLDQYHRSQGRMYYGTKGEALRDTTGDFAQTIDPWETLNSSMMEAARTYGFSGYKQNMLERFKNTYGNYLDVDRLDDFQSLYGLANAGIKTGVDARTVGHIRQEQSAIRRLLNFETGFEKDMKAKWHRASEWILGDAAEGSLRSGTRNAMYWLEKNNPVQALRSFTFDANLGFFNIGQLFIQSSTLMSAAALSPRHGGRGMTLIAPMKYYAMSGYRDDVLDVLSKNGAWKMGFDSADEFKEYAKFLRDSNLYEVSGQNMAQIREVGANRLFGAAGAYDALTEKGRMFFYFAEQANRTVSSRIAWGELKEAGVKVGSAEFRERFAMLTDDYSMNMMSQTSAGFQHGLPSIPTQFWAYSFRMMDALLGKRFTPQQKFRLLTMNMFMGGAAGVPGGALIKKMYEDYTGEPVSIEDADGWVARGAFDGMAYLLSGADVEIGQKIGSADLITNVMKDIMGKGEYGEKSVIEMMMGAAGGKLASVAPALWDVVQYSAAEKGIGGPLEQETWLRLAKEFATVKNASNALYANAYNTYKSRNGTTIAANLPDADAFFFAMGFVPGEQSRLGYYFDQSEDAAVKDAAKKLTNWRQEAFTVPDKYEDNRKKAQAFMSMMPPHLRAKVLERAATITDNSLYDSMARRFEIDRTKSEFIDEMVPAIEAEVTRNGELD